MGVDGIERDAVLSQNQQFRYRLSRWWGSGKRIAFCMLNPSTANAFEDDPTIRRCIGFAQSFGYDGLEVVNLFSFRATDPEDLKRAGYLVGPETKHYWQQTLKDCSRVVCAWGKIGRGSDAEFKQVATEIVSVLECLGLNKDGTPKHPLYLASSTPLQLFYERTNRNA